jgi:hypothetical protein
MSDNLNLTISEKFEKELVTFMLWISDSDYKISKGKESEELDWTIDLLSSFEEPGRNKLECFIKELKKMYFISYNEEEINDIKSITKNFRENKSKISKNVKVKKNSIKTKKEVRNNDNKVNNDNKNDKANDICKLDLTTEILVEVLGMPKYCKNEYIKYKWDIKCEKTDKLFMIYNWVNKDGSFEVFEKTQWYLTDGKPIGSAGCLDFMNFFSEKKLLTRDLETFDNIDVLDPNNTFLEKKYAKKEEVQKEEVQKEEVQKEEVQKEEVQKEEVQKEEENYENLEIDLDDIEF